MPAGTVTDRAADTGAQRGDERVLPGRVHPQVVVCLGATAVRAVLGRSIPITRSRGQRFDGPDAAPDAAVFVTTHPSAVLRLRGKDDFDEAFDRFVADLETAASAIG